MTTIGQQIYNGMGVAAWLWGFLLVLLGVAAAIFLVTYGALLIARSAKPRRGQARPTGRGVARRAEPEGYGAYDHAPAVGRHVRKGA